MINRNEHEHKRAEQRQSHRSQQNNTQLRQIKNDITYLKSKLATITEGIKNKHQLFEFSFVRLRDLKLHFRTIIQEEIYERIFVWLFVLVLTILCFFILMRNVSTSITADTDPILCPHQNCTFGLCPGDMSLKLSCLCYEEHLGSVNNSNNRPPLCLDPLTDIFKLISDMDSKLAYTSNVLFWLLLVIFLFAVTLMILLFW